MTWLKSGVELAVVFMFVSFGLVDQVMIDKGLDGYAII
jgi:hypothetical protein